MPTTTFISGSADLGMTCETHPRSQVDCQACTAPCAAEASPSAIFASAHLELFQDDDMCRSLAAILSGGKMDSSVTPSFKGLVKSQTEHAL